MNKEELELMESMKREQQVAQEAKRLLNRVIDDGTLSMELVRDVLAIMADKDAIMCGSDDVFSMIVNAVRM